MPVSVEEFLKRLQLSNLLPAERLDAIGESGADLADAEEAANRLVEQDALTRFQADVLLSAKPTPLVLDQYVLIDRLGAGGMGEVFKARHRLMGRVVALKVLSSRVSGDPESIQRFLREIQASAALECPHVVAAYDARESQGLCYLVTQYVEGKDLAALLKQKGRLEISEAADYAAQAARGLQYAHERGVIHRDVKPANLMRGDDGLVRVLDLGLARLTRLVQDATVGRTITGPLSTVGTVAYMSPEQIEDSHAVDERTDVYGLGCTLYHLIAGHPPYAGGTLRQRALAHLEQPVPSLRDELPETPEALDAVVQKMMQKSPADRYPTMEDVAASLEPFATKLRSMSSAETGASSTKSDASASSVRPATEEREISEVRVKPARNATLWAVAAAIALVVAAIFAGTRFVPTETSPVGSGGDPTPSTPGVPSPDPEAPDPGAPADWPNLLEDPLTDWECLSRLNVHLGRYSGDVDVSKAGMNLRGGHTGTCVWVDEPVGEHYRLAFEFLLENGRAGVLMLASGPGRGTTTTKLSILKGLETDSCYCVQLKEAGEGVVHGLGEPVNRFPSRRTESLADGTFHRAELVRQGDRMTLNLDGAKVGSFELQDALDGPLHSRVGVGTPANGACTLRNVSLYGPPLSDEESNRLKTVPLLPADTTAPSRNLGLLRELTPKQMIGDDWTAPPQGECELIDGRFVIKAWPRFLATHPLLGAFAVEIEFEYLPWRHSRPPREPNESNANYYLRAGGSPTGFRSLICFSKTGPRFDNDEKRWGLQGWAVMLPHGTGANILAWYDGGKTEHLAADPFFTPAPGRRYVARMERVGDRMRLFSDGRFLVETRAPREFPAELPAFVGMEQAYSGCIVHRIAIYRIGAGDAAGVSPTAESPPSGTVEKSATTSVIHGAALSKHHELGVNSVAVSPDGSRAYLASDANEGQRYLGVVDLESGEVVSELRETVTRDGAEGLGFLRDGQIVAIGRTHGVVELRKTSDLSPLGTLVGHRGRIKGVFEGPGDGEATTIGEDGAVYVWDLASAERKHALLDEGSRFTAAALSGDRSLLAHSEPREGIVVRAFDSMKELARLGAGMEKCSSLRFLPNSDSLLVSGHMDGAVVLWSLEDRESVRAFEGHANVVSVDFLGGGEHLVTGSADNTLRIWRLKTGREVHRFEGKRAATAWIAVTPNEEHVVSAGGKYLRKGGWYFSYRNEAFVWDVPSRARLQTHGPLEDAAN